MKATTKFCSAVIACLAMGAAFAEPPSVKVLTAPLVRTADANGWYPTSVTSSNKLCTLIPTHVICTGGRPAHVKELARSLGSGRLTQDAYTSRVFEYVYANVDTEFRYGLSKGALGAVLDQSGTPFDQAMLMVELLREANFTAGYRAGTIDLNGTQFADWTGITSAQSACRLLADGGIPAEINNNTTLTDCVNFGTATVSRVVMSHVWVSTNSKLFDPSYKKYTVKAAPALGTITTCGSTTTCATNIRTTAIPSGTNFQGTETIGGRSVAYVQRVQTSALDTTLKNYGTQLENYMKNDLTRVAWEVEDAAGGRVVNLAAIPQPPVGAAADLRAPILPTQQRSWDGGIPDAYRTRFRIQAGLSTEIDQWLFADEVEGYWLTIAGGTVSQQSATSSRYMELHLWGPVFDAPTNTVILQKSNVTASWTTASLTLSVDHPYYAPGAAGGTLGTYMDEIPGQTNALMTSFDTGAAGTVYVFVPTYVATSWGRTGGGRVASVGKNSANIYVDQMNYAQWPCDGTKVGDAGGIFCDRILDGALATNFTSWMAQATDGMKIVDGINNSRTEHHHTFGIFARIGNSTFTDARSAISTLSVANATADRQSAAASQVAMIGLLEGVSGAQQNDSWGVMSSIGLFGLANEKGLASTAPAKTHRFYEVTTNNVTQVLGAVTGYSATDKSFVRSYLDATNPGYSAIISRDGSIGSYTWGSWTTQFLTTPIFAYSSDATRLAYVSTGRNKGAGSGSAAYDAAMESVKLADPKKKREVKYSIDLAGGTLSMQAAPDIETGQGGFPYSLPFLRSYSSSTVDHWEGYWIQYDIIPVQLPIIDPSHALSNGWRHNYEIVARISNDGFQALGADSGLDASAAVTAMYAMRALNVGTQTFQTRVASIFVMDWLGKQMVDNAVVVERPPAMSTYQRLPSGLYNPPNGSSEILERTGARTRSIAGATNFDYNGITFSLTDSAGGVLSFSVGDYDSATTYASGVWVKNKFKADSWVFPEGVRLDFEYEGPVHLPSGNDTTFHDRRYLKKVSNNLGRSLTFAGGQNGNYDLTVTDENNRVATIGALGAGATDSGGVGTYYDYAGPSLLSGVRVQSNQKILGVGYDSLQRAKYVEDGVNNRTTYYPAKVSNERFSRAESIDAINATTTTFFDEQGRPLQLVDAVGRYTTNVYDGIGRLTKTLLPEQNGTEFTYDVRGNKLTETARPKSGSGGLTTTSTYFTGSTTWRCPSNERKRCNKVVTINGPRTDVTDVTTIVYNQATGQESSRTGPTVTAGASLTTLGYDVISANATPTGTATSISLLTSRTQKMDATRSVVTSFGYQPLASKLVPASITADPGGANLKTQIAFDSYGNLQSVTDPRGKISRYCFDGARRLTRVTSQIGTLDADCAATPPASGDDLITIQEFDQDGNLSRVRRREGELGVWRDTRYQYTTAMSLETETDPEGNVSRYDYDQAGRLTMTTDPSGRKTRTFYFEDGKKRKEIRGYQFAATSTDESCAVAGSDQECFVRLAYAPANTSAANYNGNNVYSATDANGNVTAFTFDSYDRPSKTTYADSTFDQNQAYDEAGNVTQKLNRASEVVVSVYDALSQITSKTNASFPAVSYGYDLMSHRTSVNQTGGQAVSWAFDSAGRIESTTAGGRTLGYKYDDSGNRRTVTWPDGYHVDYTYDDANRVDLVKENDSQVLADYTWDTLSRRKSILRGNGDNTSFEYEDDGDLKKVSQPGLPTAPVFDITRNAAHQIRTFVSTDPALFWTPAGSSTTAYTPNNLNQYTSLQTPPSALVNIGYDSKGNLTSDGTGTYTYDAENRLTSALVAGVTTNYSYDGMGRRISKKVGTASATEFLLDGDEEVAEYSNNQLVRRYVYGPGVDERLVMYEGVGTAPTDERYYYTNHQYSTIAIADGNGVVTETMKYSAYGETSSLTGNPFKFTGRRVDVETGLYYFRARYYSPKLGRFLQTDPVGTKDDYNLYAYVYNDPLSRMDPLGLFCLIGPCQNGQDSYMNGFLSRTDDFIKGVLDSVEGSASLGGGVGAEVNVGPILNASVEIKGTDRKLSTTLPSFFEGDVRYTKISPAPGNSVVKGMKLKLFKLTLFEANNGETKEMWSSSPNVASTKETSYGDFKFFSSVSGPSAKGEASSKDDENKWKVGASVHAGIGSVSLKLNLDQLFHPYDRSR